MVLLVAHATGIVAVTPRHRKVFRCARCGKPRSVDRLDGICSAFCLAPKVRAQFVARMETARGDPGECWPFRSRLTLNGAEQQTIRLALWLWKGRRLDRLQNVRTCPRFGTANRERSCINPRHLRVPTRKRKLSPGAPIVLDDNQRAMIREIVARGLSQREVARRLGLDNNVISRVVREGGKSDGVFDRVPKDDTRSLAPARMV